MDCELAKIHRLGEESRRYVRPLYWLSDEHDAYSYIGGGSFFVVRTEVALFGVTADHVIRDLLRTPSGLLPRLGFNRAYDVEASLICRCASLDIATFSVTPRAVNYAGIEPVRWPPLTPTQGKGVVVTGYFDPGRRVVDGAIEFLKVGNPLVATRVGESLIEIEIDAERLGRPEIWQNLMDRPAGFSGCPMMSVTTEKNCPLQIGGVVVSFVSTNPNAGYFEVRRVDRHIRPNGSIVSDTSV